jgi:predicted acyltransferase
LLSVDAFRGLAIAAMILLNNPGDWSTLYWPLKHAEWHGCTPTDLIFPCFLFIVGVAIVLALKRRTGPEAGRRVLVIKVVKRAAILFGLGLVLTGYPFGLLGMLSPGELLATWRIPGVLQRIAVCYLLVSLMLLYLRPRALKVWTLVLLLGYMLLITLVPVPGQGAPDIDSKHGNLAAWLDRTLLGDHIWADARVYDPEGILSTIPALATTLLGVFAGLLLCSAAEPVEKVARLLVWGTLLTACGTVWGWFLPLNKALWTSSFAVLTAGLAMSGLALCSWFFDIRGHHAAARPLVIFGVNAIAAYTGSSLLHTTLEYVGYHGRPLQAIIYGRLFASWLPPGIASLSYAITWVAGWFAVLAWMYRRQWFLKV